MDAWKQTGWDTATLNNRLELDMFELVPPIHNKGNGVANDTINDSVRATYTIIRLNPSIKRKGIADIFEKSLPSIARHLAILMKEC